MNFEVVFLTFGIIFINELGDKSQILAMTSSLAYRRRRGALFWGGSLALAINSLLAVMATTLIPAAWLPYLQKIGGAALALFALWLLYQLWLREDEEDVGGGGLDASAWTMFWTQFVIVFGMEFGDKTQFSTLALALKYQEAWGAVLLGSVSALVLTQALSVWGVHFVPKRFVRVVQYIGVGILFVFGVAMGGFT